MNTRKLLKTLCLLSIVSFSQELIADEWENKTISDATIKNIQGAKYAYKQCVADEMQKAIYQQQESRTATEAIVKQCEGVLAQMREIYLIAEIPDSVTDRHISTMRLQTTRLVLQDMMFNEEAARKGIKTVKNTPVKQNYEASTTPSPTIPTPTIEPASNLEEIKTKCQELGFKPKSDKFGKCVLKLTE